MKRIIATWDGVPNEESISEAGTSFYVLLERSDDFIITPRMIVEFINSDENPDKDTLFGELLPESLYPKGSPEWSVHRPWIDNYIQLTQGKHIWVLSLADILTAPVAKYEYELVDNPQSYINKTAMFEYLKKHYQINYEFIEPMALWK